MPPVNLSLDPYAGPAGIPEISHLIRRTTFVHGRAIRDQALSLGIADTITQLLDIQDPPSPPLNYGVSDPAVPIGETWVDALFDLNSLVYRTRSLYAWTAELMATPAIDIREKMVLFWINHFAIAGVTDPHYLYRYSGTIRTHALGNVRDLVKAITIDPAMLRFLNGNSNTSASPNENYARELLELFTVGKGPLIAPGDYSNYTEGDIKEIARVLTGWVDAGYFGFPAQKPQAIFRPFRHDRVVKKLSYHFDNVEIDNMAENEFEHLIDIIFQKPEVARHICRKLYRFFVYYEISEEVENIIIEGLAQTLVANNYEIAPVLSQLFSSEHFFDPEIRGCQIKNPYEFLLPVFSTLEYEIPARLAAKYGFYTSIYQGAVLLDMEYFNVPQVAGWKAYYQEPVYYRYWINNVTLNIRKIVVDLSLVTGFQGGDQRILPDLLHFVSTLSNPTDPNDLIRDAGLLFFTQSMNNDQIDFYKEILIPGLPDFEWTLEYSNYLADPDNELLKNSILVKLIALFSRMMNAPDFHLQ